MIYSTIIKPTFDFLFSFFAIVILSPLLLLISVFLFFANNGIPFFTQSRPGKNKKIFKVIKFKTMNDKRDAKGNLLSDADRLTSIGKFIRKTSLDELPQLINVLKGDMSIIGPRPLLVEYLPLYNDVQNRRHEVKPGITGWAQIKGRNTISWEQKFRFDVWYVDNISFVLDMKILLMTFKKVIKKEGISQEGHTTSERFKGNN